MHPTEGYTLYISYPNIYFYFRRDLLALMVIELLFINKYYSNIILK